jgi:Kef-type K+ transport system membrane component KefB
MLMSFSGLAIVAAVAFLVPLTLGFFPRVRVPSVVVEIAMGIVIGPFGLGWVSMDPPIRVLSIIGMAALLFLSGMEIEYERLRGRTLSLSLLGFAASLVLGIAIAFGLQAASLIYTPLFVAFILAATAVGLVIPILKDAGEISTDFGQIVVAGASIADFGTVILLALFFSREAASATSQLVLLGAFGAVAVTIVFAAFRVGRAKPVTAVLLRLQHTTAQIRVRGAMLLLIALVAVAQRFGLEAILAAFIAGSVLTIIDRDAEATHPQFRQKLEGVGFGVFVPVFFVASGIQFDLGALLASRAALLQVPIYLVALLVIRGLPALLYRPVIGTRRAIAAGLLQATTLGFVVAGVQMGLELKLIDAATSAALVASALLSVLIFPFAAAVVLKGAAPPSSVADPGSGHPAAR